MLNLYRKIAVVSSEMLDCARRGDWDALVAAERRCRALIDEVRALGECKLSAAEFEEKYVIMRKLLADDREIRDLTQPWMKRLQAMLASAGNKRRLDASYGNLV